MLMETDVVTTGQSDGRIHGQPNGSRHVHPNAPLTSFLPATPARKSPPDVRTPEWCQPTRPRTKQARLGRSTLVLTPSAFRWRRRAVSGQVATMDHDSRRDEVLVQVVDPFNASPRHGPRQSRIVEEGEMLYDFTKPHTPGMGAHGHANFAASSRLAMFSVTPATRHASIWHDVR